MNKRIYVSLFALALAFSAFAFVNGRAGRTSVAVPASYDLLSALPASDFILYADTQRLVSDTVPSIFAQSPEQMAKINAHLERFKTEMGFDLRTFDAIAIGAKVSASRQEPNFAVLARGRFDVNTIIDAGFAKAVKESRGNYERQAVQYEGRIIYVLTPRSKQEATATAPVDGAAAKPAQEGGSEPERNYQPSSRTPEERMAVVALDANTFAFGTLKNVRAVIDASMGRERVSDELVQLATRTPNAVVSFSGNVSPELARSFKIGNGQTPTGVESIRQVYGSFSASGNEAETSINLRTENAEQARQVGTSLNTLKSLATMFGGARASDARAQSFVTLIKGVNVYAVGNEVQITSKFAPTDLAALVRMHRF